MSVRLGAVSAALLAGVLAVTTAAPTAHATSRQAALAVTASSAEDDLFFVRWLSTTDPRRTVRDAAHNAIMSSTQEQAIALFLPAGYESAIARAAATRARNADFAARVLATTVREVSPEVYAAALNAVNGTDIDRANFVRVGYPGAKERDRLARATDGAQARALLQSDRDFVARLRDTDPGEQVRASAAWATRVGATDDDIVDFFAYGWMNGASIDRDVHRMRLSDNDVHWKKTVDGLLIDAEDAEQAANKAAGEAAVQARAAAARAWQAVGRQSDQGRTAWVDAEKVAREQAGNWHEVAIVAAAAQSPNWAPVEAGAERTSLTWATDQALAAKQAERWQALLNKAREGETRMSPTAG